MGRPRQLSFCAVMLGSLLGCHQRVFVFVAADGGADATGNDGLAPLTLDVAVTGCATFDTAEVACTGTAPLTVAFSPVGSPQLTSFLWMFGDGTPPSSDRAPQHTYTLPGSYDVNVTGAGSVGTVSQQRRSLIVVEAITTGAPCDVDAQCADGLHCLCGPGTGCSVAFLRGICSTTCDTGFCGAGAACAAYPAGGPSDAGVSVDGGTTAGTGGPSIGGPLCLATCLADTDCAAGFVCEQLPAGVATAVGWVHGCLPRGAAGDLGASCRGATGNLDGTRCTSGFCADVGTLGICSAPCDDARPCPTGAACAHLGSGQQVCLVACSAANPCTSDPALACASATTVDAGGDADAGFSIIGGDAASLYCAPG